ncbi:MAG: hypothetical protein EBY16_01360 [Gammaproteobacteria bacterium]|nr:hypothetical protein [Gammaproteobacteria bacterium]
MPHPHVITVATRVDEVPTAYQKNIDDPNLDAPNLDDPIAEELTLVVAVRIEESTTSPIFLNNILLEPFNMILCPIIIIIPLILELYQMAIIIKSGLSALYSFLTKDTDSATNNDALNVQQCDYSLTLRTSSLTGHVF